MNTDTERLNAIESGFVIWQTINLETSSEQWICQYGIDRLAVGDTMREALDNGIKASKDEIQNISLYNKG